ncbi:hypothetical protein GCM10009077_41670 [Roseibium denhamense]
MCRRTSNTSKREPGPSSTRLQLLIISSTAGVALIGAGVTAYFMRVLLNNQQAKTKRWRKQLRAAIAHKTSEKGEPT